MTRTRGLIIVGIAAFIAAVAIAVPVYAALNDGTPPAPSADLALAPNATAPTAAQIAAVAGPAPADAGNAAPPAPIDEGAGANADPFNS